MGRKRKNLGGRPPVMGMPPSGLPAAPRVPIPTNGNTPPAAAPPQAQINLQVKDNRLLLNLPRPMQTLAFDRESALALAAMLLQRITREMVK